MITQKEREREKKSHPASFLHSPREAPTIPASGLDFNPHDSQPSEADTPMKVGGKKENGQKCPSSVDCVALFVCVLF